MAMKRMGKMMLPILPNLFNIGRQKTTGMFILPLQVSRKVMQATITVRPNQEYNGGLPDLKALSMALRQLPITTGLNTFQNQNLLLAMKSGSGAFTLISRKLKNTPVY